MTGSQPFPYLCADGFAGITALKPFSAAIRRASNMRRAKNFLVAIAKTFTVSTLMNLCSPRHGWPSGASGGTMAGISAARASNQAARSRS